MISKKKEKRPGHKPEWDDLPARRCDNCGRVFKPKQPHQRFDKPTCRFEAKNYGAGYARLKMRMEKNLRSIKAELETNMEARFAKQLEAALKRLHSSAPDGI